LVVITLPLSAEAENCGKIKGQKIVTYGGMSCNEARRVYKAFQRGHTPKSWACGQSAGACGKGKIGFTFRFN
jgi:hypothetical protein